MLQLRSGLKNQGLTFILITLYFSQKTPKKGQLMLEPCLWGQTDLSLIHDFPLFLISVYLLWLFLFSELIPLSRQWVEVCLAHHFYEDYFQLKTYLPLFQHKVAIQNGNS